MSDKEIFDLVSDYKGYYNYDLVEVVATDKVLVLVAYKNGQKVKEVKANV